MTDVDLDRLADYVGGALDGTPEADAVADLVATDPRWSAAYSGLIDADLAVRSDLAAVAREPQPMPPDVLSRLTAALAVAPGVPNRPRPTGRPADDRPPARAAARRRRRWAVALTAAAAVLAVGVVSVAELSSMTGHRFATSAKSGAGADTFQNGPAAAGSAPGQPQLRTSGRDYAPDSVRDVAGGERAAGQVPGPTAGAQQAPETVPDALSRLRNPGELSACLTAITQEYRGQVRVVDYARYQGSPALVVLLSGAFGKPPQQWVVVVGPRCGEGGAITDELYNAPVG